MDKQNKKGTVEIVPNTPITRKLAAETIRSDSILRTVNNRLMAGHLDYDTHQKIISEYQNVVSKLAEMNGDLVKKLFQKGKKEKVIQADDNKEPVKNVVA
jgi:hypothetical protein